MASMERAGTRLRAGLEAQAAQHGIAIRQTGPVQMPFLSFADDVDYRQANVFAGVAVQHGVYLHPRHNWFLCSAHTDPDIDRVLEATAPAFAAVRDRFGA